jgi:uncharacterized protein (DUF433 family)
MQLEDYFDVCASDEIRIRGSRIGIESVLYEYLYRSQTAEEIARRFDTLTLEQVYATILYYLHNEGAVRTYLANWLEFGRTARDEQSQQSPEFVRQMRQLRANSSQKQIPVNDLGPVSA